MRLKRIISILSIVVAFLLANNFSYSAKEVSSEPEIKNIFFDLGYGQYKTSFALGFRYWFAGLSIGVTGIDPGIPGYTNDLRYQPSSKKFNEERYTSLCVSGDLYYYYDISDLSLFANIGYYSQADTILAYYPENDTRYTYKNENKSGITFGLGGQYSVSSSIMLGLGYHSKRGIYAQLGIFWF